jgi:hypothetical protein
MKRSMRALANAVILYGSAGMCGERPGAGRRRCAGCTRRRRTARTSGAAGTASTCATASSYSTSDGG